jgi:hypothetical protein
MGDQNTQRAEGRVGVRPRTNGPLPLAVRQRLWDQIWTRLLAPPTPPEDKAPHSPRTTREEGGEQ